VFGDVTSFLSPIICMLRVRHFGSSSSCESSDALDDGLEHPESKGNDGDDDRGECVYTRLRLKRRYSVLRFTHVPPKSRATTTNGSMNAPAPMVM
jgi:hypothetical protein